MSDVRIDSLVASIAARAPDDFNLCDLVKKHGLDDGPDYRSTIDAALTASGLTVTAEVSHIMLEDVWCETTLTIERS